MVAVVVEEGSRLAVVGQVASARPRDEELSAGGSLLFQDEDLPAPAGGAGGAEEAGGARSDDDEIEQFILIYILIHINDHAKLKYNLWKLVPSLIYNSL